MWTIKKETYKLVIPSLVILILLLQDSFQLTVKCAREGNCLCVIKRDIVTADCRIINDKWPYFPKRSRQKIEMKATFDNSPDIHELESEIYDLLGYRHNIELLGEESCFIRNSIKEISKRL